MKKTKICCFDVQEDIIKYLRKTFNVYDGSFGTNVNISNESRHGNLVRLLINNKFPPNLHEYNIFISDLKNEAEIKYSKVDHIRNDICSNTSFHFGCYFPTTIFNPKPMASAWLRDNLNEHKRFSIHIVFQGKQTKIEYQLYDHKGNIKDKYIRSNYDFIPKFLNKNVAGEEVCCEDYKLAHKLLDNYLDKILYFQTFFYPQKWNTDKEAYENDIDNFLPLLRNKQGDIVSYIWWDDENCTVMLPQVESKLELLKLVFNEFLYVHFSEYFPDITHNAWTNQEAYRLPNEQALLDRKEDLKQEYEVKIEDLNKEIEKNKHEYAFLHKILTETDRALVDNVITFMKWLGFTNVRNQDDFTEEETFEEDIQIDLENGELLVIEVKGIHGTSKDSECSQISKIRYRRNKQRNKVDTHALYIVNNERNVEPLKRTLPPFNKTQISDAKNDDRGLAYTWQLYNLYFNIENGVISKEEARKRFLNIGLLNFNPNLIEIGTPYKYYQNNKVACIEIKDIEICIGDTLAFENDGRYFPVHVIKIQMEKEECKSVKNGKVGLEFDAKIPQNHPLYFVKHK